MYYEYEKKPKWSSLDLIVQTEQCNFLKSGSLPPGLSRVVEVKLKAKEVGTFTTVIKIKSPNEILEMPIHARIELPTKHNPRTGPKPNVVLLREPVNAIGKNNRNNNLENKINDDNNNQVEEKAQDYNKWKLAHDEKGEVVFPLHITPR